MPGSEIRIPELPTRIRMTYSIDEALFGDIKRYQILPSLIIKRALKSEVQRRKRILKELARKQIVNRYSGEVLTTK